MGSGPRWNKDQSTTAPAARRRLLPAALHLVLLYNVDAEERVRRHKVRTPRRGRRVPRAQPASFGAVDTRTEAHQSAHLLQRTGRLRQRHRPRLPDGRQPSRGVARRAVVKQVWGARATGEDSAVMGVADSFRLGRCSSTRGDSIACFCSPGPRALHKLEGFPSNCYPRFGAPCILDWVGLPPTEFGQGPLQTRRRTYKRTRYTVMSLPFAFCPSSLWWPGLPSIYTTFNISCETYYR